MEPQERHYNINTLNKIFAIASLVLLTALIGLFGADYSRGWKNYQKQFHDLEIEKNRVKYDTAIHQLEKNEDYQKLLTQLEEAKKEYKTGCANLKDVQKEIDHFKADNELASQKLKFVKSQRDAARYRYENAQEQNSPELEKTRIELAGLEKKMAELTLTVEQSQTKINEKSKTIDECSAQLKDLERQERSIAQQKYLLERKLQKIDPADMNLADQMADLVRDLPVIDFANPSLKIEQIVLKDITDNVNFMQVPKVERCTTCHLGIANPEYKDAPQPFRTHPNLDLFLGNDSKHPLDEFGCTVCHEGRGRGTDFSSAAHTPSSPQQAKEWKEKYNWHHLEYWETPMLANTYVESGCFKCHSDETVIKGAEKLSLGLNLIEKAGCYACHAIEKYKDWPKPGPDLSKISSKLTKDWTYRWIENPQSFRRNTWMPSFFGQSNNTDPESLKRSEQEIHAIVHYLFSHSEIFEKYPMPAGDAKHGEELVSSIGCFACHQIEPNPQEKPTTRETLRKEHGPNFIGMGTKTSKEWIFNWIKDPQRYHPETRMPNLRLDDQQAADAAEYLSSLDEKDFNAIPIPAVDEKIVNQIVLEFLMKVDTKKEAEEKAAAMDLEQKLDLAGEKLIGQYGCYSCHNIKGFENQKPIGTELTEEGSKPAEKLDFGFIDIEHTNYAWFEQKLKDPRIFDHGKVKAYDEKLKMPNFHLSDEKIEAITTAILGFVKDKPQSSKMPAQTMERAAIQEGQKLVRQFNCQACHLIEGQGGTIQENVKDWLIKYNNLSENEAQAVLTSFSPPNLIGEGKKVQAEWLFEFLHEPQTIRPWLKTRMPTFHFSAAHLNVLIKYFYALDHQEFPFSEKVDTSLTEEEYKSAEKLFSKDYFDCAKCHIVGDQMPAGSPESWAPNFALAKKRLKPEWIVEWIKNPQNLLPSTKMPAFFDQQNFESSGPEDVLNGDENEQIRVLRNYLMTLSDKPAQKATEPPVSTTEPVAQ